MRKLLRKMAKAQLARTGSKENQLRGNWRRIVNAYPTHVDSGTKMDRNFWGKKRYKPGHREHLFVY